MSEKIYIYLDDDDIIKNQNIYDPETLEWNIIHSNLSLRILTNYQILTPYICAKYVIFGGRNGKYADCTEDAWIDFNDILRLQPHIKKEELSIASKIADQEDKEEEEREFMEKEDKIIKSIKLL